MALPKRHGLAAALAVVALVASCGDNELTVTNADGSAEADVARADGDEDVRRDSGEAGDVGGSVTQVVAEMSVVVERLCDLDGDGLDDNAVADLGSPGSAFFATVFDTLVRDNNEDGSLVLVHIPWVEDLAAPDDSAASLIIASAYDTDDPPDRSDDFSGDEPFWVAPSYVDACGEPLFHLADGIRIERGSLETDRVDFPFSARPGLLLREGRLWGSMGPWGTASSVRACGYLKATDLAASASGERSELETLLAGGAPLGIATLPGLQPDLDLDGDGIERFLLDDEWRLESCIDGDSTVIVGRDCAADDRIADGFSFTIALETLSARLAGLFPGWEDHVEGTCVNPPAESAWDPH